MQTDQEQFGEAFKALESSQDTGDTFDTARDWGGGEPAAAADAEPEPLPDAE